MKLVIFLVQLFVVIDLAQAATFTQLKVGDGSPQDPSSALEVKSTTQYSLLPRMTTTQKNAISNPQNGAIVYDTTLNQFSGYQAGAWASIGGSYTFADSLNNSSGTITLKNDSSTPGNSKYYGTNGSGTLGYFGLPNSAVWGSITGTLSSQTDLQSALNLLAPLASPTFTGTVSGTFAGNITGNVTGNASGTASNITGTSNSTITTLSNLSLPFTQLSGSLASSQLPVPQVFTQTTTPSSPSSGHDSLYFKSDNNLYSLNSSGLESQVGPGMQGTNWTLYVPTSSGLSIGSTVMYWRRVGDSVEIQGLVSTSGSSTSSTCDISLPTGLTINGSAIGANSLIGSVEETANANLTYILRMITDSTNTKAIISRRYGANSDTPLNDEACNALFGGGDIISVNFKVPITGWTTQSPAVPGQAGANNFVSSLVNTISGAITNTFFTTFDNSPAFTFTPTVTGTYTVSASVPLNENSTTENCGTARIYNTSANATLLTESQGVVCAPGSTNYALSSVYIQSVYVLTAGTSYIFDIQGYTTGATSVQVYGTGSQFYMYANLQAGTLGNNIYQTSTLDGQTANAFGGAFSANNLYLQSASSSKPGLVNNTTQTFSGSKTLGSNVSDKTTVGATSSTAIHQINGGVNFTTRTVTGSFTIDTTTTDETIFANCSAACTFTLPNPATSQGRELQIIDINGQSQINNITLAQHASENINGVSSSYVLAGNLGTWGVTSDGTNWWVKYNPFPMWAFGAGTDGAVSVTSSSLTSGPITSGSLTRDAYFSKLTMGSSGVIKTAGFKIFAQVCDFSAAITGAITATGGAGGNGAAVTTAGSAGALPYASAGTLGVATVGIIGGVGGATTGTEGATATAVSPGMGGPSGAGAVGGTGTGGAGGAARAAVTVTTPFGMPRFTTELLRGIVLGQGGGGAPGGSGAGGNSTAGGGGGGGGSGGGVVYVACGTVVRGTNTNSGIIQAIGGAGGNGGTTATSGAGGGSGGPGGGGGMIYFLYAFETGSAITHGLDVSGGQGGSGGNATGSPGTGGGGAGGGGGGRIDIFNITTGIGTETFGGTATTGNAASGTTGGAVKAGQVTQANL